jgi:hypothetical protein
VCDSAVRDATQRDHIDRGQITLRGMLTLDLEGLEYFVGIALLVEYEFETVMLAILLVMPF